MSSQKSNFVPSGLSEYFWWWSGIALLALLGQFARTNTALGSVSWYEILLALWILRVLTQLKMAHWLEMLRSRNTWVLMAFFIWTILSTALNTLVIPENPAWPQFATAAAYLARLGMYVVAGWLMHLQTQQTPMSPKLRGAWQQAGAVWLGVFATAGILQYLALPDLRSLWYLGWDEHLDRAVGTLLDPGFFGAILAAGWAWIYCLVGTNALAHKRRLFQSKVLSLMLVPILIALVLSASRASYLAWIVGVVWLELKHFKKILLWLALFAALVFLLPKDGGGEGQRLLRTASIEARQDFTQDRLKQTASWQWLIGSGWYSNMPVGEHGGRSHATTVDSTYLHVLTSTGIIGGLLWSWLLWRWWQGKSGNSAWRVVFVVLLAHGVFAPTLWHPWVMLSMVFLEGTSPAHGE